MIKPVLLWTDALVFLLVILIGAFFLYVRQKRHLQAPWRRVMQSRLAMISIVILFFYVTIALLDSVHFREALPAQEKQMETRYSVNVLSLFDVMAQSLRENVEKSYSSPMAVYEYTKITVELPTGERKRMYPRLQYGGAHLQDPEKEWWSDVTVKIAVGSINGLVIWVLIAAVFVLLISRKYGLPVSEAKQYVYRSMSTVPWHVMMITLGVIIVLMMISVSLASGYHLLGTDKVGEDVFYQALKSIRTALIIGTLTTLIMLPFAIMLGIMAGYFRGWVDDVIQYMYTTLNSIPGVLLIASAILMLRVFIDTHPDMFNTGAARSDMRLLFLCLILGVTSWTGLCRYLRGETLKLHQADYVQAATAFGVRHARIMSRHLLPNVMHIILITVVLDFSGLVLAEAILSYVGIGVDPTMNSWGNMINSARLEMAREPMVWWSLLAAFILMFVLVLAANLFSDAVRDAFDPRLRKG